MKEDHSPQPTVSVVIPAWNAGKWLGTTLASALVQTLPPLEVLVVDDGSSDDTAAIAESFGPPVRLIRQANAGGCAARNLGIAQARGEFVALLDHDDVWLPEKLAQQVSLMQADPQAALVFCDYKSLTDPSAPTGFQRGPVLRQLSTRRIGSQGHLINSRDVTFGLLKDLYCQIPSTWLLRRSALEAVGGFEPALRAGGEDLNIALRLAGRFRIGYVDQVMMCRREHSQSLGQRSNLDLSYIHALELLLDNGDFEMELQAAIRQQLASRSHHLADGIQGDDKAAEHLRALSFRLAGALPPGQMLKIRTKVALQWAHRAIRGVVARR